MPHDAWMQERCWNTVKRLSPEVELDIIGLQTSDPLLVLVIDIGKNRVFALRA